MSGAMVQAKSGGELRRMEGAADHNSLDDYEEYLTFTLDNEEYGVDILKVQEIRGYDAVTRLPSSPEWIKGVINLRGTIIPVVDMRIKFKLGAAQYDAFTVMIILNVGGRVIGMVVDAVSDVTRLTPDQLRPAPELGGGIDSRYISRIGSVDQRMLILLDIERMITSPEMALVDDDRD